MTECLSFNEGLADRVGAAMDGYLDELKTTTRRFRSDIVTVPKEKKKERCPNGTQMERCFSIHDL